MSKNKTTNIQTDYLAKNNMLFTWLPVNLPAPPAHFVQRAVDLAYQVDTLPIENTAINQGDPTYRNRTLLKDGKEISSRIQYGYALGSDWDQWVQENILSDYISTGGRLSVGTDTNTHGAHVDSQHNGISVYKLYYLIDPGNADTTTVFFKEQGCSIERKGTKENICRCDDYSKLEIIDQVKFPVGQWVLLNTNILHGVENVSGTRINLVVMFATLDIASVLLELNNQLSI